MHIQEAIDRLRTRTHVPLFVPDRPWDADLDHRLRNASAEELFAGREVRDPQMAACAIAGLHLWNDNFTSSHKLCQGIPTPTGSYWHGIGHRREGHLGEGLQANLANAKYWFRRVDDHPAYDMVYRSAVNLLDGAAVGFSWAAEAGGLLRARHRWDPFVLVDWFAEAEAGTLAGPAAALLEEIQWREMALLVDWCLEQALA
jgi:hypothetical protein